LFPSVGHAAAWGVTISGVLQLALLWWQAARAGLAPRLRRPARDGDLGGFFARLGPAVVGSAGTQIAMFADTILASTLPAGALASLYYAERLYQLPLGVVGIAAGTVLLPTMSRLVAAGDPAAAHRAQNRAMALTLALSVPAAIAFLTVPDLLMTALFQRGAFDAEAARRAGAVLAAYSVGLPAAVLVRSLVASFYSRRDTATPLWASFGGVGANVALKVVLTDPYGAAGLALATSVGVWLNVGLLWLLARRRGWTAPDRAFGLTVAAVAVGGAAVAAICLLAPAPIARWTAPLGPLADLGTLAALVVTSALAYGLLLALAFRIFGLRLRG
ncbi:MAG: polysaccharide biosynthesis C-terminal domain-containing protein, partial [Methylobacteriaceae bacterium]|nr:polysaccharide biosynthesis C-terminal domain-containing protein [Methylobacteriaceae bacterium]